MLSHGRRDVKRVALTFDACSAPTHGTYNERVTEILESTGTPATIFIWRIHILGQPVYQFRAGESCAGERLLDWASQTGVEGIFQDLKPAHTMLIFAYA